MKIVEITGANAWEKFEKTRVACRGIVISEGKILLTYESNTDQWFIPGGGLEGEESLADCCARELAEETGKKVAAEKEFLTLYEYYGEWKFESHYFVCTVEGEAKRRLTEREIEVGLEPRWVDLFEALDIFSRHLEYKGVDEMKRGAYLREHQAMLAFLEFFAEGNEVK